MSRAECRDIILLGRETQFDPSLVDAFSAVESEFNRVGATMGFVE